MQTSGGLCKDPHRLISCFPTYTIYSNLHFLQIQNIGEHNLQMSVLELKTAIMKSTIGLLNDEKRS